MTVRTATAPRSRRSCARGPTGDEHGVRLRDGLLHGDFAADIDAGQHRRRGGAHVDERSREPVEQLGVREGHGALEHDVPRPRTERGVREDADLPRDRERDAGVGRLLERLQFDVGDARATELVGRPLDGLGRGRKAGDPAPDHPRTYLTDPTALLREADDRGEVPLHGGACQLHPLALTRGHDGRRSGSVREHLQSVIAQRRRQHDAEPSIGRTGRRGRLRERAGGRKGGGQDEKDRSANHPCLRSDVSHHAST
jgi:hypothetical protein